MMPCPPNLTAALAQSHVMTLTGEVWQNNRRVGSIPLAGEGSVTQDRSQFQRRSGTVTTRNTRDVREMLTPGACVRAWWGVQGVPGKGVPLLWGPIIKPARKVWSADITLTVEDMARRVLRDPFVAPRRAVTSITIPRMIETLWRESWPHFRFIDLSGSAVACPPMTWEGAREDAITDLASSIGCETWFRPGGSGGEVVLAPIPDVQTGQITTRVREHVNLADLNLTVDWDTVINHAVVVSDRQDGPQIRGEWVDETSPTGILVCGPHRVVISSAAVTTSAQATTAARGVVLQSQGTVTEHTYTSIVDPRVEVSDVQLVTALTQVDRVVPRRVVVDRASLDIGGAALQVTGRSCPPAPTNPRQEDQL